VNSEAASHFNTKRSNFYARNRIEDGFEAYPEAEMDEKENRFNKIAIFSNKVFHFIHQIV